MATPTTATPANGTKKDGSPRKKPVRIPRTQEEIAFSACNSVLKRLPAEMRGRVMRSLTALHSVSN